MSRLRVRLASIIALVVVFGYLTLANFASDESRAANPLLPDTGLRLGLDLQGGIHWVLGVKLEVTEEQELEQQGRNIQALGEDEDFTPESVLVDDGRLVISGLGADAAAKVGKWVDDGDSLRVLDQRDGRIEIGLTDSWRDEVRERGMRQVLEVLRRRIDDPVTGIPESVVARQGADRVLVQIPGGSEAERKRAGDLIRTTGFLEFKMVRDSDQSQELLEARYAEGLPEDSELVFELDKETQRVLGAYLVSAQAELTGAYLDDARVQFDRQGRPTVGFTFNPEGGEIFGALTTSNIGNRLAIILDDQVYSAPTIQSRITMRGEITGRFTPQEAADLAIVLRAGSLSVPVEIEEERTVGPALGADSIERGVRASILGLALILLFVVGYYRMSGVYAGLALGANLLLLLGVMSLFEATLTLPGMAGIVLTVGMAVDANVIIFERIREELRAGKAPRAAIATGFNRALWTILDANITTLITALVLFEYGTGPIKGFAVTLSIGVVTSVFTAMVITRALFAVFPGERQVESLSI